MSKRKRSIQAHVAHSHQNGPHISHRERNVYQLLVLVHPLWYLYAQPCSGPPKPQIDFTIRVSSQLQNWPADVFRVIQHHIISPPKRRQHLVAKTSIRKPWPDLLLEDYHHKHHHLLQPQHAITLPTSLVPPWWSPSPIFPFLQTYQVLWSYDHGNHLQQAQYGPQFFSPRTCINIEQDSETKSSTAKHVPIFPANALMPKTAPNYLLRFNNVVVAENIYK